MTDSIRPLILMATPAFQPFATVPRTLTYAELGLPDDWEPRWDGEHIEGFGHLLAKMAEEVWARTEEPTHDAATGLAELEDQRDRSSRSAYLDLEALQAVELFAMAGQAALVGFALSQTMHYASDLELWVQ